MFSILETLARMDSTIMLYGESGVGKEVATNFIRRHSGRKDAVIVPVNCASIPNELIGELSSWETEIGGGNAALEQAANSRQR